jgi:PAS domain S-box-containing protein
MTDTLKFASLWYRRIAEGVVLVSLIIIGLYGWVHLSSDTTVLGQGLLVSDAAAILAGIALTLAAVSYLWAPKRYPAWPSLLAYTALWCAVAVLIVNTGGGNSPFIAFWILAAIFAGVFGAYGILPIALAPATYLAWLYLNGGFAPSDVAAALLAGELPLILSCLVWTARSSDTSSPNHTYQQLASELSQVTGKAEVVINAITDGVIALNSQGNIQLINPAAQQLIGWGKRDAVTLNYKSVLQLTDNKGAELVAANDPVGRALATNQEVKTNELTLITNSGKKLLVSLVISPVGQPGAGVIIVFRDITKEKTEEHQQAEFISTASHEMRTPVAAIEGYLGLALNPATAQIDAKAHEYITKAHEAAEHLGRLFQDLLDVSKAEDGRLSNSPSVVDVVAFTQDIVQGLKPKAEAKGLRMIFKPQPDDQGEELTTRHLNPVFYVNVDNDHLREVIANLVENAIKYTPNGTVVVDVGGDGEHVTVSVEDSGIGIPTEDQPHLFQKFYRVDSSDTREIGGTGLGLYLCRRLTEAMNGRIWVESQYKQGSTFYVELPRLSHEEAMRLIEAVGNQAEASSHQPVAVTTPPLPVAPAPTTPTDESMYVSPPANAVAAQLSAMPPESAPGAPRVPSAAYQQPQPSSENPSLAAIEQHPDRYLTRPSTVNVPPRDQNQP